MHAEVSYAHFGWLFIVHTALIWQKEASDKSDITRKRAKCVCHLHWRQWNIMMSYLTYLLIGWVFLHEIWPGRRAHYVNYENINNSNLDGMSLASFCQSRAAYSSLYCEITEFMRCRCKKKVEPFVNYRPMALKCMTLKDRHKNSMHTWWSVL